VATSGISATIPGLLDYESPLMLDIPDAAAVILDILSREARYVKSYATVCNLNSGLGCVVGFKCNCCSKVLYYKVSTQQCPYEWVQRMLIKSCQSIFLHVLVCLSVCLCLYPHLRLPKPSWESRISSRILNCEVARMKHTLSNHESCTVFESTKKKGYALFHHQV
jgi:hypothetical protein